jgi:hypothetical protein
MDDLHLTVVPDPDDAELDALGPSPDLAALLARGIPSGLVGPGIDPASLTDTARVVTVNASFAGIAFDSKSGGLRVAFLVPPAHQYLAMGLRDAARLRLVLSVYAPESPKAREQYGRSAATELTEGQRRKDQIAEEIRDRQLKRRVARDIAKWTGPDGPGD